VARSIPDLSFIGLPQEGTSSSLSVAFRPTVSERQTSSLIGDWFKIGAEMRRTPTSGRKSLNDIKEVLARWGCISA